MSIDTQLNEAIEWRRKLHRCPQPAWTEYYATGLVAEKLTEWGYELKLGNEIVSEDKLLLLPDAETRQVEYKRALSLGINQKYIAPAAGGCTGVVGVLKGTQPGPTIGFRFDIDCNQVFESIDSTHRPAKEGFVSNNSGYGHMCGHDVHTATGLLLAKYFADNKDKIKGTVKFIFQPNEENLSGAAAMVEAGVVDDVDYLFGGHVGTTVKQTGHIGIDVKGLMAMTRFEVSYTGRSAHAAIRPDEGKNALLGACTAISNLYAISRHGMGMSRVNVGTLEAGTTWNVIPDHAYFRMETRGETDEINNFMVKRVMGILEGAAQMYDLKLEIKPAAAAIGGTNSLELVELASNVVKKLPFIEKVVDDAALNGSEDFTSMMQRVQQRGGQAMFALFGTPTFGGHHNAAFDVDETVMAHAAKFYAAMYDAVVNR